MSFIDTIKNKIKDKKRNIVLPETDDKRILESASKVKEFVNITLIGEKDKIISENSDIDLSSCNFIDPNNCKFIDELINEYYMIRKHKGITLEYAKDVVINDYPTFACMLVKKGYCDGMVSGANHTTSDTFRCALQIIKTEENIKASSFIIMDNIDENINENGLLFYSDCGMIQNPTSEELVDIAYNSYLSFKKLFNKEPNIALLSHSSFGSSICDDSIKVKNAVELAKEKYPFINIDGEMQFDTAVIKSVAMTKAKNSSVAGRADILIFPDLDAGNIAYKITERLAGAKAYGPIAQGLNKPVNDLSRGSTVEDIIGVILITAYQSIK